MARHFHKETLALIALMERVGTKSYEQLDTVEAARYANMRAGRALMGHYDFNGQRNLISVPSPDVQEGIPCYIYKPDDLAKDAPILCYFHGGGMVVGTTLQSVDTVCKIIADKARCLVSSVDYRLSPEYKFPAQMDDAACVLKWIRRNKVSLGMSNNSRVGVAGDSAGATIAASVAHDEPDISFQILVYPRLLPNGDFSLPSYTENADGPILSLDLMKWFGEQNMKNESDARNPRFSSLLRERFDHLPPTLFVVAEYDPLRDDSYEYAKKLTDARVPNEFLCVKGAPHGFFTIPGFFKECCEEAHSKVIDFIKRYGFNQTRSLL